jgi:hypothetical protein
MTSRQLPGIICCAAAAVVFVPSFAECPIPARVARDGGAVRIEHQLVRIHVTPERPVARVVRTRSVTESASAARAQNPAQPGLLGRATRALVGDGRYRPDPFPRPGK